MCHTHLWKGGGGMCACMHTHRHMDSHMHTQAGSITQAGVYGEEEKPL